jgi:hypothetical protein
MRRLLWITESSKYPLMKLYRTHYFIARPKSIKEVLGEGMPEFAKDEYKVLILLRI